MSGTAKPGTGNYRKLIRNLRIATESTPMKNTFDGDDEFLKRLRRDALELCWQIEKFHGSELQTETVTMASSINEKLCSISPTSQELSTYEKGEDPNKLFLEAHPSKPQVPPPFFPSPEVLANRYQKIESEVTVEFFKTDGIYNYKKVANETMRRLLKSIRE